MASHISAFGLLMKSSIYDPLKSLNYGANTVVA
jgi:hypothetical protein